MNTEDILRMAREAGMSVKPGRDGPWDSYGTDLSVERFFKLAYEAGAAAERERIIAANAPEIERINAHIEGMRDRMISEGWRQCAQGQKTTQFCAVAEQARLEEREACALIAEAYEPRCDSCPSGATNAIRARGQQQEPDDANPSFG